MKSGLDDLKNWIEANEGEHFEFKEAKNRFSFDDLLAYCVALANERGGKLILGVTDKKPRKVVGSGAFPDLERKVADATQRLNLKIQGESLEHPDGRVVVFHVPSRPIGLPVQIDGSYLMRAGDSLVPMTHDQLKRIFEESEPDYSAKVCPGATVNDLDPAAISYMRSAWRRKSGNAMLETISVEQLLHDAELIVNGGVTYAGLILLGSHAALGKFLAQAEVVFEYRPNRASGPAAQRIDFRMGVFLFLDKIWETINLRNEVQHFQQGFFMHDIPTFSEVAAREAVLNAVSHRDYRLPGSVFIRQYPRELEIVSPGGFPDGVTPENILWRQSPRNRRIADVFAKCGFVERAGQGANLMFEDSIRSSKPKPDFFHSDSHHVFLTLRGDVQDPKFVEFLEKVSNEKQILFTTEDLVVLDLVHREQAVPETLKSNLTALVEQGVIEAIGRGKGVRYILSRRFYQFLGQKGIYTRKRGLDRETNKELLLKHIRENKKDGTPLKELTQVLPAVSSRQIQALLHEMEVDGEIHHIGKTNAARWYPVDPVEETIAHEPVN